VKTLPAFETKQTNNQSRRSKRRLPLRTYKAGSFSTASGFSNRVARRELRSLLCVKITVETTPSRRAERTNKGYKTKSHPLGEVLECNQSNQPSETRDRSFPPNRDRGVRRDANHAVRKARLCVTKKTPPASVSPPFASDARKRATNESSTDSGSIPPRGKSASTSARPRLHERRRSSVASRRVANERTNERTKNHAQPTRVVVGRASESLPRAFVSAESRNRAHAFRSVPFRPVSYSVKVFHTTYTHPVS